MSADAGPVVVAFDGSASSRHAVGEAARLLSPSRFVVLTVWEPGLAYSGVAGSPDASMPQAVDPSVVLEFDDELRKIAEDMAAEGVRLAVEAGIATAEPLASADQGGITRTILGVAEDLGASAIVVGSRGLTGLRARLEGSTSSGVVKRAKCPVLVVHDAEE